MPDDHRRRSGQGRKSAGDTAKVDEYARQFDQKWHAAIRGHPGAAGPDPALWNRIRDEASPRRQWWPRSRRESRQHAAVPATYSSDIHEPPGTPSGIPSAQWHRGLLIFAVVVFVGCIVILLPGGNLDPRYGAIIREAPELATPEPETGCNVVPLTSDEVLAIVINVDSATFRSARELFPTPPPWPGEYPHTKTWLPEADGTVDMANGSRPVRRPTVKEFRQAEAALDRYLRCQVEGNNYQLWALESPVEVQRQILQQISVESGWLERDSRPDEEITETMILDTIEEFGPQQRAAGHWYMRVLGPGDDLVGANPDMSAAFVADDPETGEVEYAWIATQWVDAETGDVTSVRGAALGATPIPRDGYMDNLVVMILKLDPETGLWLVEWLVPTI